MIARSRAGVVSDDTFLVSRECCCNLISNNFKREFLLINDSQVFLDQNDQCLLFNVKDKLYLIVS